jgi:hypothetical protein
MKAQFLLAAAALASLAAVGARADEADGSQYALKFQSTRSRAEVHSEAVREVHTRSTEPAGSHVAPAVQSSVDGKQLRAEAAQAVRIGQLRAGEIGSL